MTKGFPDCLIFRIVLVLASDPTDRSLRMIYPDPRVSRGEVASTFYWILFTYTEGVWSLCFFHVAGWIYIFPTSCDITLFLTFCGNIFLFRWILCSIYSKRGPKRAKTIRCTKLFPPYRGLHTAIFQSLLPLFWCSGFNFLHRARTVFPLFPSVQALSRRPLRPWKIMSLFPYLKRFTHLLKILPTL